MRRPWRASSFRSQTTTCRSCRNDPEGRMSFSLLIPVLLAADPGTSSGRPAFVLHSIRDDLPAGPLVRLDADGTAQVGSAPPVAGADVVALRRQDLPPSHFPQTRP